MVQYKDIIDNISTGILALDTALKVVALNASGEALLQTSETRSLGLHARQLVLHPEAWLENLEQVLASNTPITRRGMPLTLHTGEEVHVDLIITPVATSGNPARLLVELQPVDRLLKISREDCLLPGL